MDILNMLNDISLVSYEDKHIYRIYSGMALPDLLKEYKVTSMVLSAYHANDLEGSIILEYLCGIFQIMCLVISERTSEFVKVEVMEECM